MEGEEILVRIDRRLGNKLSARYKKEVVAQNYTRQLEQGQVESFIRRSLTIMKSMYTCVINKI